MMDCVSRKNSYSMAEKVVDDVVSAYEIHPCEDKGGW
jgi:hypothetical protein